MNVAESNGDIWRWIRKNIAFALFIFTAAASQSQTMMEYDPVMGGGPPFRRQFLDAMVVEESSGLERVFHSAKKYESNPIFRGEAAWEGWGPNLGGSVIRFDGGFRMYYYCISDDEPTYVCMAESKDGIHWTRPDLGLVEWNGSKRNNIIDCSTMVGKIAHPDTPEREWITFSNSHLGYSPDGLHWTWEQSKGVLFSSSDVINWFFDPYRNRMCATWKTSNLRHRACGVVWSKDLVKWDKPYNGPVFVADDLDPDPTQIYGMPVFAYQGMFIGLPLIYHARWLKYGKYTSPNVMFEAQEGSPKNGDIQLAWSWDLVNWTRTIKREPFIPNGRGSAFDCGFIGTAREPLVMGDELWFYYSGWDQVHVNKGNPWDLKNPKTAVGLAMIRLDGFCSMSAGKKEGWFISRREVFNTPKVLINAKCVQRGSITAEMVDRNNNVIPGFEKNLCIPFTGDSVHGELTWKTKEFPKEFFDKDKKVKFYLKNADIYSYLSHNINRQIDDGRPD
jgi:hypothetical protein